MLNRRRFIDRIGVGLAAAGVSTWGQAAASADTAGLSATHLTIGSSLPSTGPLGNVGPDAAAGIQAAFADVNRTGGINGRELRFVSKDDGYAAPRTLANVKEMLDNDSAFAFISVLGTANNAAVIPLLEKAGAPLLGPLTGAASLRRPEYRHIFHIRPSYTDEVARMVQQLVQMGIENIAVVYLDNPLGKEVLANARAALAVARLKEVAAVALAVDGKNAADVARQVQESKAGVAFLGATGTATTAFVLALQQRAQGIPIMGLSVTFTDPKGLAGHVKGLARATVLPDPQSPRFAVVRNYRASLASAKLAGGPFGFESWVNAQVIIEGIRRAGRDITRDKLRNALAGIHGMPIGEVNVDFGSTSPYVGTKSVKLGIYDAEGFLHT